MRVLSASVGCLITSCLVWGTTEAGAQTRSTFDMNAPVGPTVSRGSQFGYNQDLENLQYSMRKRRAPTISSVSRFTRGLAERSLSTRGRPASKPFANVTQRPTLSPYLNLLRNEGLDLGGLPNYHTFVRPALEQEGTNRQTSREIQGLSQQVEAVNRQLAFQPAEAGMIRPTGHQTVFMNHSHYYNFAR